MAAVRSAAQGVAGTVKTARDSIIDFDRPGDLLDLLRPKTLASPFPGVDGRGWVEAAVRQLIVAAGDDPNREGLRDTPARVERALRELTAGYRMDPKAILATTFSERHDEMIVLRGVEFWSLCEHHLMPFHGRATVGYLPGRGKIVGLSKLARLVECYARRYQVQERMTDQIAAALQLYVRPRGVGVVIEAEHLCMKARGARMSGTMVTSSLRGVLRTNASARAEFLQLARGA